MAPFAEVSSATPAIASQSSRDTFANRDEASSLGPWRNVSYRLNSLKGVL